MAASAAGRRDAFEVPVARHLPRLTSYCAKLTRDAGAAEDLAQDTLLAPWHRCADHRPERALRLLVFTIALNRCRNHARSWRRRLRWLGILERSRRAHQRQTTRRATDGRTDEGVQPGAAPCAAIDVSRPDGHMCRELLALLI